MKIRYVATLMLLGLFSLALYQPSQTQSPQQSNNYHGKLSDYGFFIGPVHELKPSDKVIEYELNTPLFSDYAHKQRLIYLPPQSQMKALENGQIEFPLGTILIKTFYYPADFNKPLENRRLLETRLLVLESSGWITLNYLWQEDQKEALLDFALHYVPVHWKDEKGEKHQVDYQIPNLNLCKVCHLQGRKVVPLGPSLAQLNRDNQLENWVKKGWLHQMPNPAPRMARWDNPQTGSLAQRARAWLDVNCAHCHRRDGSANISGLILDYNETDPLALGIRKKPVTRALMSEQYTYDIEPGKPENSILVYRIETDNPALRMPKIACQAHHREGLALIKDWIRAMQ